MLRFSKPKRPFPKLGSFEEAKAYLKKFGELEYFGKIGDYYVYNYHVRDGRLIPVNIYTDGKIEVREV